MNKQLLEYSYGLRKERKRKGLKIFLYIVLIIAIINLIFHFVLFPVKQISNSMNPDISEQSNLFVSSFIKNIDRSDVVYIDFREENKGFFNKLTEIIVYSFTGHQVELREDKNFPGTKPHIRRIVGVPGDTVYMRDYVLYVKPAGEKHYLTEFELSSKQYDVNFYVAPEEWDSSIGVKGSFDEIVLGKDEYFVLGDNRKSCFDSRMWGPVNENDIKGKILLCYFPFNEFRLY